MKVGSLFSGIGGFDLAARWMGWETAWYSEIDPYASAVMAHHFPTAVNHGDITKIDGKRVEKVELLVGGFPCQDISLSGKGAGLAGARSGLWSHYARLIEEIRPSWVVIENSPVLRSRGLDSILGTLDAFGYDAEWHCLPASSVGAPHTRDRLYVVAYTRSGRHGAPQVEVLAGRDGLESGRGWPVEPNVGRVANGVPSRVDRLKCLGNAIVPQVAYEIFQAIERSRTVVAA